MAGLLFVVMVTRSVTLIVLVLLAALACGPKPPGMSLVEAVTLRNVDTVQRHMEIGTDPNESFVPPDADVAGASALHLAVVSNNREIAELLLANGADINIPASDEFQGSPLEWAAFFGVREMAIFLIAEGADLNSKNALGGTPLDATTAENPFILVGQLETFNKSRAFLRMLLIERGAESGFPEMSLLGAIDREDLAAVEDHLASGVDPNESFVPPGVPAEGASALHLAVLKENREMAEALLNSGTNIDIPAQDQFQGPPLEWAAFFGLTEMVVFLVEAGADVNAKNAIGTTPLDAASADNPFIPAGAREEFNENRAIIRDYLVQQGAQ